MNRGAHRAETWARRPGPVAEKQGPARWIKNRARGPARPGPVEQKMGPVNKSESCKIDVFYW